MHTADETRSSRDTVGCATLGYTKRWACFGGRSGTIARAGKVTGGKRVCGEVRAAHGGWSEQLRPQAPETAIGPGAYTRWGLPPLALLAAPESHWFHMYEPLESDTHDCVGIVLVDEGVPVQAPLV